MELLPIKSDIEILQSSPVSRDCFIEANTVEMAFDEIESKHIIPVWLKDNERLISHTDFIKATTDVFNTVYPNQQILSPAIRVSHPIKGRIPSARDKKASELLEEEKTLFFERMMFCIEVPGICTNVGGNDLTLVVGGVKAYSEDNLYQRTGADQHFKLFAGFQNTVCTNLCVWTDGFSGNLRVRSLDELYISIRSLLERYQFGFHLQHLDKLTETYISESQFAQIIGRCRLYQHLPYSHKQEISPILLGEQQLGAVVKAYYRDPFFQRSEDRSISLWKLYNLLTGANKSSYIDNFLERSVNAYHFIEQIRYALEGRGDSWFLR